MKLVSNAWCFLLIGLCSAPKKAMSPVSMNLTVVTSSNVTTWRLQIGHLLRSQHLKMPNPRGRYLAIVYSPQIVAFKVVPTLWLSSVLCYCIFLISLISGTVMGLLLLPATTLVDLNRAHIWKKLFQLKKLQNLCYCTQDDGVSEAPKDRCSRFYFGRF